jgi:hypothetical protein
MNAVIFWGKGGESLPVEDGGLVAVLESEFVEWTVSRVADSESPIYVRFGSEVLQLEEHPRLPGKLRVPPKVRKKSGGRREEESRSKSYIGIVTLFGNPECTEPLVPMLKVQSVNLSPEEFAEILEDLRSQVYAVSIYSAHQRVVGGDSSKSADMMPLARFLRALSALEPVLDVYSRQLKIIERNPSRFLRRVRRVVSIERAVRSGYVSQTFRLPDDRRHVLVAGRESTLETPEKRFVESTASQLLVESRTVVAWLGARLEDVRRGQIETEIGRQFFPKMDHVREQFRRISEKKGVRPRQVIDGGDIRSARDAVVRVSKKIQSLERQIGNQSLDLLGTRIRTNKLEMSIEYSPILRAWTEYAAQSVGFDRASQLLNELDERTIAPSPILYERWVTTRLYTELLRRGFSTPPGEPNLLDTIEIMDREVIIQKDHLDLSLIGEFAGREVKVRIRHEPTMRRHDGGVRTPDLVLDVHSMEPASRLAGVRSQVWVLDAKFKDYNLPAPFGQREDVDKFGSHFLADMLGVAEHKYRRGLGVDGSAIVHPNVEPEFTYLDQVMTDPWRQDQITSPIPHSVLAIPLRPGMETERQVTRLFKIIFGFHMGLGTICWSCGSDGEMAPVPGGSQADAYTCVGCGSFWIAHWCFSCKRGPGTLLKYGSDPIHLTEPQQPFNVHCPCCGEYFREPRRRESVLDTAFDSPF